MLLARVKGSVVSTIKDPELVGQRLLLIQPVELDGSDHTLIEIGGRVNLAALSLLAELFDDLIEQKIVRAVLVWKKGTKDLDSSISQYQSALVCRNGRAGDRSQSGSDCEDDWSARFFVCILSTVNIAERYSATRGRSINSWGWLQRPVRFGNTILDIP